MENVNRSRYFCFSKNKQSVRRKPISHLSFLPNVNLSFHKHNMHTIENYIETSSTGTFNLHNLREHDENENKISSNIDKANFAGSNHTNPF